MRRLNFCENWKFSKVGSDAEKLINVPHDAMIHEPRDPESPGGSANAFFPGGEYIYEKTFDVPKDWEKQTVMIEFEGIYRNSTVYINGRKAGGRPYGYINFIVDTEGFLEYGKNNTVRVITDNSQLPNSRWYSGSGIYRPVSLLIGGQAHLEPYGVRITTLSCQPARIRVETRSTGGAVQIEILDGGRTVASGSGESIDFDLADAKLWSADSPCLYDCRATLLEDGKIVDESVESFGIRQVSWSSQGLFVNNENVLLRGGCVHHDNGVLGACSYAKAEERRVRIMKEAGFNAIRSSHYPASVSLIEACDKLGMYMIDETWDMWYMHKNKFDYATDFMDWYEADIHSLVERDYNHPSVIMYSIGNEISEPFEQKGIDLTRDMVALFHELDPGRAVTGGINLMIIKLASQGKGIYKEGGSKRKDKKTGSLMFNMLASAIGPRMNKAANSAAADQVISPCLDLLDIAGYNYGSGRYSIDGKKHPERVIFGSETFPQDIAANWQMVKDLPGVVGDFMWAGWDYLGEVGIGSWAYDPSAASFEKPYPWLLAGSGVIDILGRVDAQAHYAALVWGVKSGPYIGVRPINQPRKKLIKSVWRWTNALDSWSWRGCENLPADIEVYANAYKVDLLVNGKPVGSKKLKDYKAMFRTKYQTGYIEAIAYDRNGAVVGQAKLVSSTGLVGIRITPEDALVKPGDLAFVNIELTGENGMVESNNDQKLTVSINGGTLLGFGSANPISSESFDTGTYTTFHGRAMAVVKADQGESLDIKVTGHGLEDVSASIQIKKEIK